MLEKYGEVLVERGLGNKPLWWGALIVFQFAALILFATLLAWTSRPAR